jgi:hypothetical protein
MREAISMQSGTRVSPPWHLLPGAKQASLDCPLHEQRTRRVGREQADGLLGRERGASEIAAEIDDEIGCTGTSHRHERAADFVDRAPAEGLDAQVASGIP